MEGITLHEHFASLQDPRVERTKRHELLAIITIALCAVICAADTWVDVEEFGHAKRAWLETFLELPNGTPSHDTFGRVFARLDPEQFQACFLWLCCKNLRGKSGGVKSHVPIQPGQPLRTGWR